MLVGFPFWANAIIFVLVTIAFVTLFVFCALRCCCAPVDKRTRERTKMLKSIDKSQQKFYNRIDSALGKI